MASWDVLTAFAIAAAVFAFMPGPALLYTAAQTLARGQRAGLMAMAGIHLGCYVHVFAAAFGLSAIFKHVPEAFLALKAAGALYLIWLGIQMARAKLSDGDMPAIAAKSPARAFIESIAVEILNPKVAIFFIAFLPQFVDPAASLPVWAQFLILGTIVNLMFSSADLVTVLMASRMVEKFKSSSRGERMARITGGGLLCALGVKLAFEKA